MVFNEENFSMYTTQVKNLYEPYLCKIKIRHLCFPFALLFVLEDTIQLYLTYINYYERPDPYYTHVHIPVNFILRFFSILAAVALMYGALKEKSTPIALFLWTQFEVNILYATFFCYEGMQGMVKDVGRYEDYVIMLTKMGLWWIVNSYHNYVKEKEFITTGQVRMSLAFTSLKQYKLPEPKTSI